tara:strand:- start:189 stop:818 length:630 start_codon:yes stop_codon:yes gene_type:complete
MILFDLDGTLIDSFEGIYSCYKKSIKSIGLCPVTRNDFKPKIGASFDKMITKVHPEITEFKIISQIVKVFRDNYDRIGYKEYVIFEGIEKILQKIENQDIAIGIVSNKKNQQVEEIMSKEFAEFKIEVHGKKDNTWSKVEESKKLKQTRNILAFVGDTQEDYNCAKEIGAKFIYAKYGYGELKTSCKNYDECKTTQEILKSIDRILNVN